MGFMSGRILLYPLKVWISGQGIWLKDPDVQS